MFANHNLVCAVVVVEGSQLQLVRLCLSYRSQRCTAVDGYVHAVSILSQQGPTDCFSKPFVLLEAFCVGFFPHWRVHLGLFLPQVRPLHGLQTVFTKAHVTSIFLAPWFCSSYSLTTVVVLKFPGPMVLFIIRYHNSRSLNVFPAYWFCSS